MIIGGGKRAYWQKFAPHLMKTEDGQQQVRLVEFRGLASDNVADAFQELAELGQGTRAKNFYYHANIDPRADEHMTNEQWEHAVDTLEKNLGFEGQPRFIVEHYHEDDGRTHRHVVWSRVDTDRMRVIPNEWDYAIHQRTADALEKEFGHEKTPRTREKGKPKGPDNYEYFRGKETKIPVKRVEAELSALWQQADTPQAFAAAVADKGYILCEGDRGLCIVDQAGKEHSLYRRVGLLKKEVDARMDGAIDRDALPTVAEARAVARQRLRDRDDKRDDSQYQPVRRKRGPSALEQVVEGAVEAVRDAFKPKDKEPPKEHAPEGEPSAAEKRVDPEPAREGAPAAQASGEAERRPGGEVATPAPGMGIASAEPASPSDPRSETPPPSRFERLAAKLSQAKEWLSGGPTIAEINDPLSLRTAPPSEIPPAPPWEPRPIDDPAAVPGSTSSVFERLARELVEEVKAPAPVFEQAAIVAAAIAAPELFERDRMARERLDSLREAEGDANVLAAAGIDWRARQGSIPFLSELPPDAEATPLERLTWERFSATRDNGGEPVTHDGQSFWQRARATIAATLDGIKEWARDRFEGFVDRLTHDRAADSEHERER